VLLPQRDSSVTSMASILRAWARLGKGHHLLALHADILRAGDRLLEEANDPVPSALGERTKVPLLALARLIIGADAAVDGDLSLNRPQKNDSRFDTANTGVPRALGSIIPAPRVSPSCCAAREGVWG